MINCTIINFISLLGGNGSEPLPPGNIYTAQYNV